MLLSLLTHGLWSYKEYKRILRIFTLTGTPKDNE